MTTVTLTTDFGTADGYVGEVKGVLRSLAPSAVLVDVTHALEPGDVAAGSWVLGRIWSRFPEGTVHLVVVDPGVGGPRRAVAARALGRWFVGPDNGLLTGVADRWPVEEAWLLDPPRISSLAVSDTFHGRDVFAPAAARLAGGAAGSELGPPVSTTDLVWLPEEGPRRESDRVVGRIVHVDRFGNLITNVPVEWLPDEPAARLGGRKIRGLRSAYTAVERGELLLVRGSGGTLEIAVREGSAASVLGVGRGEEVVVETEPPGRVPREE